MTAKKNRIRLNQEYRNKIANKIEERLQMEDITIYLTYCLFVFISCIIFIFL